MRTMNTIELEILGKTYKINSDKDVREIAAIADFLKGKIEGIRAESGIESSKDLLVLTLLTVIEEYWDLREEHEKINLEIDEIEKTIERHL